MKTLAWLALVLSVLFLLDAAFVWSSHEAPSQAKEQPEVLRRLELRVVDLDKTHPTAGGERYRRFECREVPR